MDVKLVVATLMGLQVLVVGSTTVDVPGLGKLLGTSSNTQWTSQKVFEFRAINYAVAPFGDRRFKVNNSNSCH